MNLARSDPVSSNLLHRLALNLAIDKARIDEPFTQNCEKFRCKQPVVPSVPAFNLLYRQRITENQVHRPEVPPSAHWEKEILDTSALSQNSLDQRNLQRSGYRNLLCRRDLAVPEISSLLDLDRGSSATRTFPFISL